MMIVYNERFRELTNKLDEWLDVFADDTRITKLKPNAPKEIQELYQEWLFEAEKSRKGYPIFD